MPLINFKTNLTSLKFGADQPGGGDSGQPFIQSPIETPNTPTDIKRFYELNRTSLDFPIRGGAISSLVNGSYTTQAAVIDAERIKKFFNNAPRGTAFIQKQKGLQLTNPKTQVPNTLEFAGLGLGNAVVPTTWTYNPKNTLAQVGVQGNGTHFNRHGVDPTIYESVKQTYQYIVGAPENNTATTNRLTILKALKLDTNANFLISSNPNNGISIDPELVDRLGISTIQNQLFNYAGGPGSDYGIGFTRIFRATDSQGVALSTQPTNNPVTLVPYSTMALTYAQLAAQSSQRGWDNAFPSIQDFRAQLADDGQNPQVAFSDYDNYNIQTRLGVGSPGAYDNRLLYTDTSKAAAEDKVNLINPFFFDPNTKDPWQSAKTQTPGKPASQPDDIIKFAFECVSNDSPQGADQSAGQSVALIFRAFLEGAINDNNQAEYSTFKYLGRGETFRTYQGVDRSIGFTFKIFTQTRQEMRPLYKKLNWLMSQVYPDYSPTYNLMRGNVVRVTIGDYIYRMPGFLENVNVTIDNSNTPWEILLDEYQTGEDDVRQLPHIVTVQCSFRPIMDLLPRREKYGDDYVPLIVNRDAYLKPPSSIPSRNLDNTPIMTTTGGLPLYDPLAPQQFTGTAPNIQPQQSVPQQNVKQVNADKPKKGRGIRGRRIQYMPKGLNSGANALSPMGPGGNGGSAFNNPGSGGSQYNAQRLQGGY
jgi:hypothetical protein